MIEKKATIKRDVESENIKEETVNNEICFDPEDIGMLKASINLIEKGIIRKEDMRKVKMAKELLGDLVTKSKPQQVIEKTLIKHGIDPNAFAYHIVLSLPDARVDDIFNDIFICKKGDEISLGSVDFFMSTGGDLMWDNVMTFEYNNGFWILLKTEEYVLKEEDYTEETYEFWIEPFKDWFDEGELKSGVYLDKSLSEKYMYFDKRTLKWLPLAFE